MTNSQQQIIDSIKLEFEKINVKESYSGSLIDIDGILGDIAKDEITKEEVRINNEYKLAIVDDMITEDINLLNEDLLQIGLIATKDPFYRIRIGIHNKFTPSLITLSYRVDYDYTRLKNNDSILTYTGFGDNITFDYDYKFKDLQSVVSSDKFKLRIRGLYESSLKK